MYKSMEKYTWHPGDLLGRERREGARDIPLTNSDGKWTRAEATF